jgi:hypothetical protein
MSIPSFNDPTYSLLETPEYLPNTIHHKKCWFGTNDSKNKKYILTVSGKNDRFGSQYSAQMSGFAFARLHNCIYRFSAFVGDKHSDMASEFCGMKSDVDDDIHRSPEIRIHRHCDISQGNEIDNYFNENVINELRQMYYSTWKPEPIQCDVAIHIRRGDVGCIDSRGRQNSDGTPYRHWIERYDDNNYYVESIKFIRNKKNNPNLKICIFTQGVKEDFKEFLDDENITLYLNGDWRIAYHSLVKAPILVTSISEFAWTAGILSNGEIYKNPRMFRRPLKHWYTIHV